jgi:hypothetical protein
VGECHTQNLDERGVGIGPPHLCGLQGGCHTCWNWRGGHWVFGFASIVGYLDIWAYVTVWNCVVRNLRSHDMFTTYKTLCIKSTQIRKLMLHSIGLNTSDKKLMLHEFYYVIFIEYVCF